MISTIVPALTAEEWAAREFDGGGGYVVRITDDGGVRFRDSRLLCMHDIAPESGFMHAFVALANAALPDGDPRKITREKLNALRAVLSASDYMAPAYEIGKEASDKRQRETDETFALAEQVIDALAALLPPEG